MECSQHTEGQNESNIPCVYISETNWVEVKPKLEYYIQSTISDSSCENLKVHFKRFIKDSDSFFEWKDTLETRFTYPISIEFNSGDAEKWQINGVDEKIMFPYIIISNLTKKLEESHNFPCKFYGGHNKNSHLKTNVFYDALATSGISKDGFARKRDNDLDHIYVKEIIIQNSLLPEECSNVKREIDSILVKKSRRRYVVVILSLNTVSFTLNELDSALDQRFIHEISVLQRTIISHDENRIYFVFNNDKRLCLDLHLLRVQNAKEEIRNFIRVKYDNFDPYCQIMTGIGNHTNDNGSVGVFKKNLPVWLNTELKDYVDSHCLFANNEGLFHIYLKEVKVVIIDNITNVSDIIISNILSEYKEGRLFFKIGKQCQSKESIDIIIVKAIYLIPMCQKWPKELSIPKFFVNTTSPGQLIWGREPYVHPDIIISKFAHISLIH